MSFVSCRFTLLGYSLVLSCRNRPNNARTRCIYYFTFAHCGQSLLVLGFPGLMFYIFSAWYTILYGLMGPCSSSYGAFLCALGSDHSQDMQLHALSPLLYALLEILSHSTNLVGSVHEHVCTPLLSFISICRFLQGSYW